MLEVVKVSEGKYLEDVRQLFLAYADWIGIDLSFQNFNEELENLPGDYAPPGEELSVYGSVASASADASSGTQKNALANASATDKTGANRGGCLLLALYDGKPAGCVAVRQIDDGICEMKRLYALPGFQGLGIGSTLVRAIIAESKRLGYAKMRLDTMPKMGAAQKLYHSLGFKEIAPYRFNPEPGAMFMELDLIATEITEDTEKGKKRNHESH
ncbi:MAG TPA: GNAT family N-acetyltransferase [Pyrinomonadaceae bacterium]|nr:GNAT family N-acetyltransferase [Pyrinomonadaceae bacterium]